MALRSPFVHGDARYEVVGTIGQGGMGRVLEASDHQFGRTVALKELIGDASSAASVRRFVVESLVTGNLEHPGIPAVYERHAQRPEVFSDAEQYRRAMTQGSFEALGNLTSACMLAAIQVVLWTISRRAVARGCDDEEPLAAGCRCRSGD